eukprot:Skav211556  [mRNA]  locus=scaffold2228:79744:83262:+ [translate_table: standard]
MPASGSAPRIFGWTMLPCQPLTSRSRPCVFSAQLLSSRLGVLATCWRAGNVLACPGPIPPIEAGWKIEDMAQLSASRELALRTRPVQGDRDGNEQGRQIGAGKDQKRRNSQRRFKDAVRSVRSSTEVQFTDADGDVILLRLTSGKVTEYVNGELESEDVQWFGIDLSERKLVTAWGEAGRIEALFAGAAKTRSASKAAAQRWIWRWGSGDDWVRRVQLDGSELCHAPDNLKDDKDVVMAALGRRCRWNTLKFASSRLREDEDVVLKAVGSDGRNLVFAAEKFRDDKDFVLKMLRGKHWNLEEVSERLRGDKDVVIASKRLQFASSELRGNKDVVIATVRGCDLQFASEELRDDKDVVMAAVEFRLGEELNPPSGKALQYASSRLQADKDVVLKAASSTGDALQFASEDLRNDREVVWCAFREGMYCLHILEWASDEIRQDEQFMLRARNAAKAW